VLRVFVAAGTVQLLQAKVLQVTLVASRCSDPVLLCLAAQAAAGVAMAVVAAVMVQVTAPSLSTPQLLPLQML
jgi:hypothetical protein